jgi:hypothetical protein
VVALVGAVLVAEILYKGKVFGWTGDALADDGGTDAGGTSGSA